MAVDDCPPILTQYSNISPSSASSSSSSLAESRYRTQIATDNSSSFIPFLTRTHQTAIIVPAHRSRTNLTTTPSCSIMTDIQSISSELKSSNNPSLTSTNNERKCLQSQQKYNPILNNSLLNHRRETPKLFRMNISTDSCQTIELHPTTKPCKLRTNKKQTSTASLLTQRTEPVSDRTKISEELPPIDKTKYDYITRWIHEVRLATSPPEKYSKKNFSRKRLIHS